MPNVHTEEIETYLAELGQELQRRRIKQPIRILLIGGAFMLLQVKNRQATDDIDVVLKDVEDTINSPLYDTFRAAVQAVATRNQLRGGWLNDLMAETLRDMGALPEGTFWRSYGKLEVFFPPEDYMLALKLLAGRQKDQRDIEALCQQLQIHSREQAQQLVDQYIPKRFQQLRHLDETLDLFF
jgi:hypothetical protein